MKEFLFVYRMDYNAAPQGTPEQMQAMTKRWMDWIAGFAQQNKLSDRGNRLHATGKVVRDKNVITDGPYTEIKEFIGGYTLVKASSLDEAAEMAQGCPIFSVGGSVEVREVNAL